MAIKIDGLVKSRKCILSVIPAKAGIQCSQEVINSCAPLFNGVTSFYEIIKITSQNNFSMILYFDTISEITKLAGLDLYEISSGKHQGKRRISKHGRPLMRKLLFFAAINAVKSKGIMHEPYRQMLDRGMLEIKALVAVSRKLLRLIFALVRDNSVYVKNHSQIHGLELAA
jgi:hypothetical protein